MMLILLNSLAAGGRALKRWDMIKSEIRDSHLCIDITKTADLSQTLKDSFSAGYRLFIAAGGDGTVNLLVETLINTFNRKDLEMIQLGAIGLGSSNDFHKTQKNPSKIKGYPCLLNTNLPLKRDILQLSLQNGSSKTTRFALLNASCGITANANAAFNKPGFTLNFLKQFSSILAIAFAAIKSIVKSRNHLMNITTDGIPKEYAVTNLAIIKSPFFSANFAYNHSYTPDDGLYKAYICHGMNIGETLKTLFNLRKHTFRENPKSLSLDFTKNQTLEISSPTPFIFEFDGEVEKINHVKISMLNKFINCCSA